TSIKSGRRYKITNEQTKLALDLSGVNFRSIIGHVSHGGANQQWIIEQQVNGQYIIRSVTPQKYLCIEKIPDNGARLAGLDGPQFWDI
ncbi:putative mannanase, partial [Lactarius hengduanensis]